MARAGACAAQALLPAEVRDHERVRLQLTAALNAMNGAADAPGGAAAAPAPYGGGYGDFAGAGAGRAEPSPGTGAAAAAEPSLRQLGEQFAADAGAAFLPKAGRRHEGLQARRWALCRGLLVRKLGESGQRPSAQPAAGSQGCRRDAALLHVFLAWFGMDVLPGALKGRPARHALVSAARLPGNP